MPGEELLPGIRYAKGWDDYAGVGISVIGVYSYRTNRYRAYLKKDFAEFWVIAKQHRLVSFNGIEFDDRVCRANNLILHTDYDILHETYAAVGLDPFPYSYDSAYKGYGLDSLAQANGLGGKTGHGAKAPILWQQGKKQEVIDYCLNDVKLTKGLFDLIRETSVLKHPKRGGDIVFPPLG